MQTSIMKGHQNYEIFNEDMTQKEMKRNDMRDQAYSADIESIGVSSIQPNKEYTLQQQVQNDIKNDIDAMQEYRQMVIDLM